MPSRGRRIPKFKVGEALEEGSDYVVATLSGSVQPSGGEAQTAGKGGASVVYRTVFKGCMHRAVKLLCPEYPERLPLYERTFKQEIALLAKVTHTRIAKITDFGQLTRDGVTYPYFVMDFIDGKPFVDAIGTEKTSGSVFLQLYDQVLDAVDYLHRRPEHILHCDVGSKNILVRVQGAVTEAILLDLGVAKTIHPDTLRTDSALPSTYFFSTREYTWSGWRDRVGRTVTHGDLEEMFPWHDLYSLGVLLQKCLAIGELRKSVEAELHREGLAAMDTIRDRLLEAPSQPYYKGVSQLREDWAKLNPSYLAPLGVAELSLAAYFRHSIATPTGRVVLTGDLHRIVNHGMFQRLRDIRQLEFVSLIYPGARHSRLLHALTSYEVARHYVAHLLNDSTFSLMVSPNDIRAVLLWALLHDLGHYPLSHMFEDFAVEQARHPEHYVGIPLIPLDSDLFWTLLDPDRYPGQYGTLVHRKWAELFGNDRSLAAEIEHSYTRETLSAMREIGSVLDRGESGGEWHPVHSVLAGIISSAVDVDKVAYLQDDSLMTAVRYGSGIDLDALLGSLRAPEQGLIERKPVLAITEKGLSAAESVALARYWMFKRVYWHHTNRSIMAMIKYVVAVLHGKHLFAMDEYIARHLFGSTTDALVYLGKAFDGVTSSPAGATERVTNPIEGLLAGKRRPYKRLLSISHGQERELYEGLWERRTGEVVAIADSLAHYLRDELRLSTQPGDVLIDVPRLERQGVAGKGGGRVWVYPRKPGLEPRELEDYSPVMQAIAKEFDEQVKKARVFLEPKVAQELRDTDRIEEVTAASHEYLRASTGSAKD